MNINQYDKILLKDGRTASVVEIFGCQLLLRGLRRGGQFLRKLHSGWVRQGGRLLRLRRRGAGGQQQQGGQGRRERSSHIHLRDVDGTSVAQLGGKRKRDVRSEASSRAFCEGNGFCLFRGCFGFDGQTTGNGKRQGRTKWPPLPSACRKSILTSCCRFTELQKVL